MDSKKYLISAVLCLCFLTRVFSQNNSPSTFQKIQGIWLLINKPESTNNTSSVTINKGLRTLNFEYALDGSKDYIEEYYMGFQDYNFNDVDSINVKSLKETGSYYTVIAMKSVNRNGWVMKPDFLTPEIVEIGEQTMWINYGNVSMFEKIDKLPRLTLKLLYNRGKKDKHDYIKDYLNLKVAEIKKQKETVYSLPDKPTAVQLSEGDVVTVVEEKGQWLKIDYGADTLGWIKNPLKK